MGNRRRSAVGNHDRARPDASRGQSAKSHQPTDHAVLAKAARKTKRHPVLYAIAGFLIAFTLITSTPLCALTYPFLLLFYASEDRTSKGASGMP